ncbi:MAG: phage holin family protein [Candidatus Levybacteria bacterium]|nr:phage holin family protein [Candidatus Levybacteria bacterium]
MKPFFRNCLFNAFSIFFLSQILPGVKVSGGLFTYLLGGVALTVLLVLLKPVLNLLALPLNLLTLGMFSFVSNIIIFYFLTVLVTGIIITSFTFPGISYSGFVIPPIYFNTLFAFILVAFLQSLCVSFLNWLMEK